MHNLCYEKQAPSLSWRGNKAKDNPENLFNSCKGSSITQGQVAWSNYVAQEINCFNLGLTTTQSAVRLLYHKILGWFQFWILTKQDKSKREYVTWTSLDETYLE